MWLDQFITLGFIQYMDFVEIFNVSLDLSIIYFIFLILLGVDPPLSVVVTVVTLSYNVITCFLESKLSISILFYFCLSNQI